MAIYAPRGAIGVIAAKAADWMVTSTWCEARRRGFDRSFCTQLVEHLATRQRLGAR